MAESWASAPPTKKELEEIQSQRDLAWDASPPTVDEMKDISGPSPEQRKYKEMGLLGRVKDFATGGTGMRQALSEGRAEEAASRALNPGPKYSPDVAFNDNMANSTMLGYLPQVSAAAQPAIFSILNKMTGQNVEPDSYVDARDMVARRLAQQREEQPSSAMGGDLAGMALNAYAVPLPGLKSLGQGVLGAAVRGGAYGAGYGFAQNPGDMEGVVEPVQLGERVGNALEGSITGAKWGGGLHTLAAAARNAPGLLKKGMSTLLGPKPEEIDYYLKNHQDVNKAKSIEELKDHIDRTVGALRSEVDSGKMSVTQAKENLKQLESSIAEAKREGNFNFQVKKTELSQALRDAKRSFDAAATEKVRSLKDVKAPLDLADEATQAVRDLRGKVSKGSGEAFDILDKTEGKINLDKPLQALNKAANDMEVQGAAPITAEGRAAQTKIRELSKALWQLPKEVSAKDAKRLIQQIDQAEKVIYNTGGFTDDVSKAFRQLRSELDTQLKGISEPYRQKMEQVAADTKLHGAANDMFGDRGAAISRLNRIGSEAAIPEREALVNLGKQTGRDFETPLNKYREAQGLLRDPRRLEETQRALPEYQRMQKAERASRALEGPEAQRQFVERGLLNTGLLGKADEAQALLAKEEQRLARAESRLEPVRTLTENSSESKLKALMNAKPGEQIEIRKLFGDLSKLTDTDFEKAVRDLRNKNAFKAGAANGSRNVNLFAALGGVAGATFGGHYGAGAGAAAGAATGAMVDKFGPAIAKRMLDGVIRMGERPTVQAIKRLSIPKAAQDFLLKELISYGESKPALAPGLQKVSQAENQ